MFDILKSIIESGGYNLDELVHKIDILYAEGRFNDEQRAELLRLAREKSDPHGSYGEWKTVTDEITNRVSKIQGEITALSERVKALEQNTNIGGDTPEPENPDEFPPFKHPTSMLDAYNKGMGCTYNGKKYRSKADGNVYSPYAYPDLWELVEE